MSTILSFPGLMLFLAAAAAEFLWLAPTTENAGEKRIAWILGWGMALLGIGLYMAGIWMQ